MRDPFAFQDPLRRLSEGLSDWEIPVLSDSDGDGDLPKLDGETTERGDWEVRTSTKSVSVKTERRPHSTVETVSRTASTMAVTPSRTSSRQPSMPAPSPSRRHRTAGRSSSGHEDPISALSDQMASVSFSPDKPLLSPGPPQYSSEPPNARTPGASSSGSSRSQPSLSTTYVPTSPSVSSRPPPPSPRASLPRRLQVRKYYVVTNGEQLGIFDDWNVAGPLVIGYSGSVYKSYKSLQAATAAWEAFLESDQY